MSDLFSYIVLGILQGIFEWIPISSEGVVALTAQWLKTGIDPVDLALFLHLGTLLSALVYYWRDWTAVLLFRDLKLMKFLAITTAISLPIGLLVYKFVDQVTLGAGLLAVTGVGLLFTSYFQHKKLNFNLSETKLAVLSGFLQGIAAIPGFSRSGSTIFGLSLGTLKPAQILRLSYLMSIPAVAASSVYMLFFKSTNLTVASWPAIVSSFIVGLLFLKGITDWGGKINFSKFALAFAVMCFIGALLEIVLK